MGRKEEAKAANNNHGDGYEEFPCFSLLYRFSMITIFSNGGCYQESLFQNCRFYLTQQ